MADYLDNFTDTNGTLLSNHTADSGHKYESTTKLEINNNELVSTDPGTTGISAIKVLESDGVTPFVTASEFDIDVTSRIRSNVDEIAFGFCENSSDERYQIALTGEQVVLGRNLTAGFTSLGSAALSTNDAFLVEVRSSTITVKKGGTAVIGPVNDTSLPRSGFFTYKEGRGNSNPSIAYAFGSVSVTNLGGPTITDIDGDESVYPGQSFVITGTNFGATQGTGSVDIDGVAQTVTAWSDTSITCTAVRGGNEYGTGKTLTVTTDAGTTATLTVAQEAEPSTFAVTAASPNTTDPASLWSGLVDTATGDPVTVVDGDQAWVKDPNNLGNLSITPAGAISADTTGDFVVQFWKASEGVWGSDQTVSFTLPAEATDNWPFGKAINPIATKNWTWGSRHPMTGMRVRIFK